MFDLNDTSIFRAMFSEQLGLLNYCWLRQKAKESATNYYLLSRPSSKITATQNTQLTPPPQSKVKHRTSMRKNFCYQNLGHIAGAFAWLFWAPGERKTLAPVREVRRILPPHASKPLRVAHQ